MKLLLSLEWPDEPVEEWDDLDFTVAEIIHEHNCKRWPHRVVRRLQLRGQWAWNRWLRRAARWVEGPLDLSGSDLRVRYIEWWEDTSAETPQGEP